MTGKESKCWKVIGVFGDKSCESLTEYLHCKHCPVYTSAARDFFDRDIPPEFIDTWTETLSHKKEVIEKGDLSVTVFRLGSEVLAIPTDAFLVAVEIKPVHFVPFRTNRTFRGLVNIDGELLLCFSLENLLGLSTSGVQESEGKAVYNRMVAVRGANERVVFEVDEVIGVTRIASSLITKLPSTAQKAGEIFSRGIFEVAGLSAALLDEHKVCESFRSTLKFQ